MYVLIICVFLLLLSVYVGATPTHGDPTPRGGMAGASTPGGTPFRDKLNINAEEQALFDEAVPIKKQQVHMYVCMYVCTYVRIQGCSVVPYQCTQWYVRTYVCMYIGAPHKTTSSYVATDYVLSPVVFP